MNVITWVIFGLIVGTIVSIIDPSPQKGGIITGLILGVLGSVLGGFVANLVFGINLQGFSFTSLLIAVLGSLMLLGVTRVYQRRQR